MPTTKRFWVINKASDHKTAEMLIYDQIGETWWGEGVSAKSFRKDLKALGELDRLDVRINSPGGNVFDGQAIYNALNALPYEVHVHIDGLAASMASVIAMAGSTITMHSGALMMIHNPQAIAMGDANEMRKRADLMDKIKGQLVNAYVDKTALDASEVSALMDSETWMEAEEAIAKGFADEITEEQPAVAALWSTDQLPSQFKTPQVAVRLSPFARTEEMAKTVEDSAPVQQEPVRVVATVAELEAIPGASAEFIVAQLKASATLSEAKDAILAQLWAEKQQRIADDAARAAAVDVIRVEAPVIKNAKPSGIEPIVGKQDVHGTDSTKEVVPDRLAQYNTELRAAIQNGEKPHEASRKIRAKYPEIFSIPTA